MAGPVPPSSPRVISPAAAVSVPDLSLRDESDKYVWRMHQTLEPRRYQIFSAAREKVSIAGQKAADVESSQAQAGVRDKDEDGSFAGNCLRLKSKDRNRRRKASSPDVGPMTTVQEVLMDSPTIPGRPPRHGEATSAAGHRWRQQVFGESVPSCISGPASDENVERDATAAAQSAGKTLSGCPDPNSNSLILLSQRAFEHLPTGHSASDAPSHLSPTELTTLHQQALGQALRFQVLGAKDVECLSRELRALDERCGYLLKTHRSLPRFSHESMLRQEEALGELDASIDDWVSKLEQAENRRTRVRQKLLEHVAAALLVRQEVVGRGEGGGEGEELLRLGSGRRLPLPLPLPQQASNAMDALPRDPTTPPRSPTKKSFLAPVAEVSQAKIQVTIPSPSPAPAPAPSIAAPSPSPSPSPSSSTSTTAVSPAPAPALSTTAPSPASPPSTATPSPVPSLWSPGLLYPSSRSHMSALLADVEDEILRMETLDAEAAAEAQSAAEAALVGKAIIGTAVLVVRLAKEKETEVQLGSEKVKEEVTLQAEEEESV
ncbi:hypothetical protein QTJ16_005305 [Diplocarpon rosae]|uniref:Up-regulated during septation protein 1 domain-containing protein n=1 Tax=Diplocarpon rosae TaxID=946125 RepID=A0AAD9SWB5_9HELO|nr:hypothetical protein QTJ16_005305 [Diplocarpon rosae]